MGKYFKIEEFTKSYVAEKNNIQNEPDEQSLNNLELTMGVMEKIRENWTVYCHQHKLKNPQIIITSGYRSEALNEAVGGSKTSAHRNGFACDFKPKNGEINALFKCVQQTLFNEGIPFDQLVYEKGKNTVWIHLGMRRNNNETRHQVKCLEVK